MNTEIMQSPDGRYARLTLLTRGSCKIIFSAIDQKEGINVAWCEMPITLHHNPTQPPQEIFLLRQLQHPNILFCFAAWCDITRNCIVFITEYISSGSLFDYYKNYFPEGYLRPRVIAHYGRQILEAIYYLHQRNIIHCDIKSHNIFICGPRGEAKLGDLGLSTLRPGVKGNNNNNKEISTTNILLLLLLLDIPESVGLGTLGCIPPESCGGPATAAGDIWAFGLLLLELATGNNNINNNNNNKYIYKDMKEFINNNEIINNEELRNVVGRCLSIDPAGRPTAAELLTDPFFNNNETESIEEEKEEEEEKEYKDYYYYYYNNKHNNNNNTQNNKKNYNSVEEWLREAPEEIQSDVLHCAWRRGWSNLRNFNKNNSISQNNNNNNNMINVKGKVKNCVEDSTLGLTSVLSNSFASNTLRTPARGPCPLSLDANVYNYSCSSSFKSNFNFNLNSNLNSSFCGGNIDCYSSLSSSARSTPTHSVTPHCLLRRSNNTFHNNNFNNCTNNNISNNNNNNNNNNKRNNWSSIRDSEGQYIAKELFSPELLHASARHGVSE